jgi:hypothetical protein
MESNEPKKQDEKSESEATSDELLSDVEEEEAVVDSGSSAPDPGPSPDGALDEGREIKDAGPM